MTRPRPLSTKLALYIFFLATLVLVVSGSLFLFSLFQPVNRSQATLQNFTISSGETTSQIASKLHNQGLIKNPLAFRLTVRYLGVATQIQAGDFQLSPSMTLGQIATALKSAQSAQISATILEGWRREQVAQALSQAFAGSESSFSRDEFLALTDGQEGFLYPDTYFFSPTATTQDVIDTLTNTFNSRVATGLADQIAASPYTLDQIIIMASIIEREARIDRPLVSGILWKRFQLGMPLQADATLQYIKGYDSATGDWWSPPLSIDKALNSPYNTYLNPGLPPSPISNPSLSSINAALNPQDSPYLYYLSDDQGGMHYATDYEGHLQNITRYLR